MNHDSLHPQAALGFSREAHTYAKARPDYPDEALPWLTHTLGLDSGLKVLEVGAGTGKFTQRLLQTGATVFATEPVEEMRAELELRFPGVLAQEAFAERLPFEGESFDAVVCAQAFHWFANSEVLDEFARVLKPGGVVGLIWNVRDETIEWVRQLADLLRKHEAGLPRYTPELVKALFPHPKFGPLQVETAHHHHSGPAELVVVDRMRSTSFIASMPSAEQEQFLSRVRDVLRNELQVQKSDPISVPYRTDMYSARRREL